MALTISVVIPAYNSAETLVKTLTSLRNSSIQPDEIQVIDDASTDGTAAVCAAFPQVWYYRFDQNRGPAAARNKGVQLTRSEVVVFVDADVVLKPEALPNIVVFFSENPQRAALTGIYDATPANRGIFPRYKAWQCLSHYMDLPEVGPTTVFWTGIAAIKRDFFHQIGGFDEAAPGLEDIDFGRKIIRSGQPIYLNKQVVAQHHFPVTLGQNFRDHYQRGYYWLQLYSRYGQFDNYVTTKANGISRLAAIGSIITAVFSFYPFMFVATVGLILVYMIANRRFIKTVWRHAPGFLPLAVGVDYILALALGLASFRWIGERLLNLIQRIRIPSSHLFA